MKTFISFVFILVCLFLAIKPLTAPGFFPIHDDTQVARVYEMGKALMDGMFPVRWAADLGYGYGYPIFNFYAPLAYYFGGTINALGVDALLSTKIMMIVGIILSGVFMYLLSRELWGNIGGLVSSLFYVYAPYHAVDIYVRGDVAEFWAYAFIPLAFYGSLKAYKEEKWRFVVIGSLGYMGIILSHNLTAMMTTPFLGILTLLYCFSAFKRKKIFTIYYLLFTIFFGLLISAFYWLPALVELQFTNVLSQIGGGADFRDHFVCAAQLWQSPWGFGGSAPGCIDGISLKIGKLHIIVSLVAIILLIISSQYRRFKNLFSKSDQQTIFAIFSVFAFVISVLLTLEISKPIWEFIPAMAFFQFPWRFLLIISFFTSILAGFFIWIIQRAKKDIIKFDKANFIIVSIVIFTLIFFNSKLFTPQNYLYKKSSDYTNSLSLKWTASRISDEYMPENFIKPSIKDGVVKNQIVAQDKSTKVLFQSSTTNRIHANISSKKKMKIKVNLAYFPGWNIFVDNKKSMYEVTNKGFFVNIPSGDHALDIFFTQTPIEKFATSISLASLFLLITGIILSRKRLIHE